MRQVHRAGWYVAVAAAGALALAVAAIVAGAVDAGPLDPPPPAGGPTGTQKTQNEVEPRTPISSLPYSITTPGSTTWRRIFRPRPAGESSSSPIT